MYEITNHVSIFTIPITKGFIMIDILLVEDDKEICFILTELLKRNPYNVSAYHNGIEAIEALSSKKYDLNVIRFDASRFAW